jgi:hypothetical protein
MTTNFPTNLDTYADKINNVSTVLATSVNNLQDACAALQTKVGINESTASSSFDYMINSFFEENVRQMYFYMNIPPVGWSTSGLATNCVVGVKGGTNAWNTTGGTKAGTWTIDDQEADTHLHQWRYYPGSGSQMFFWDSTGSNYVGMIPSGLTASMNVLRGILSDYNYIGTHFDRGQMYIGVDYYTSNDSHSHTFSGNWRPNAAMGILAKYTGA